MRCYLVRRAASLGVLGIFWAETSERLWWLVDQANADPGQYEFTELADGYLAFTGETEPLAAQMKEAEAEPAFRFDWSRAEPSEVLLATLHQQSRMTWRQLPSAGEPGSGLREPATDASDEASAPGGDG